MSSVGGRGGAGLWEGLGGGLLPLALTAARRRRAALQQVRDAASGRVGAVFQLYEAAAAAGELGLAAAVRRSALSPSLADALAWLRDAERCYRQAYPSRRRGSGRGSRRCLRCCPSCSPRGTLAPARYLECELLLLRAHREDLSELEALPRAWGRLLERHNPDVVEGNGKLPRGGRYRWPCARTSARTGTEPATRSFYGDCRTRSAASDKGKAASPVA